METIQKNRPKIKLKEKRPLPSNGIEAIPPTREYIDTYKCIKLPLIKILPLVSQKTQINNTKNNQLSDLENISPDETLGRINDAVIRTHKIIVKTMMLLRQWVLLKYHQDTTIPLINKETIKMVIQVVCSNHDSPRRTKKHKQSLPSDQIKNQTKEQVYQEIQHLNPFDPEDNRYLSSILNISCGTIVTAIENNIKCHFPDYVKRYVNVILKNLYAEQLINAETTKKFYHEISQVKEDLLQNRTPLQYHSDPKYHGWITEQKVKILHKIEPTSTYYYDIHVNPQTYLKHMLWMNLEIAKIDGHLYQFFPLRTSIIPAHIEIDTKALIELLVDHGNNYLLSHIQQNQDVLWKTFFKIDIKYHNYSFAHAIITDGLSASVRMIHVTQLVNLNQKLDQQRLGRERARKNRKLGIDLIREVKNSSDPPPSSKSKLPEFLYFDEVPKEQLVDVGLYADVGKRELLTMLDNQENIFRYTIHQRIHETKRIKYRSIIDNFRLRQGIIIIEQELSDYNSKTCEPILFRDYMLKKIEVNERLYPLYSADKYRQYRWYGYLNTIKSDQKLVNHLKEIIINKKSISMDGSIVSTRPKEIEQRPTMIKGQTYHQIKKHERHDQKLIRNVTDLKKATNLNFGRKFKIVLKSRHLVEDVSHDPMIETIKQLDDHVSLMTQRINLMDQEIQELQKQLNQNRLNRDRLRDGRYRKKSHCSDQRQDRKNRKSHDRQNFERTQKIVGHHVIESNIKPIMIMGDWSIGKQMRNFVPTPNLHLKRLLSKHFRIYNEDEFRTSCVHYRTNQRCENFTYIDTQGKKRKLHSVLTYQMENQRLGCINRDNNGCHNIRKLFRYYMETNQRPDPYQRGTPL
jgi:hypothetical protein